MDEHFGDVLAEFVGDRHYSASQLEDLTDIPQKTIVSWLDGRVKRPREWKQILQVAAALRLYETETDRLLRSIGQYTIAELRRRLETKEDPELKLLLEPWLSLRSGQSHENPPPGNINQIDAPFQVPQHKGDYFVGRQELAEQIAGVLKERGQICVLYGMAGVGKTALATQLAYSLRSHFPDGVLWAELKNVGGNDSSTGDTIRGILTTLAHPYGRNLSQEADLESCSRVLREILANKKVLLILDNAHSSAEIQYFLPPSTENCSVLITTYNAQILLGKTLAFEVPPFDESEGMALLEQYLGERLNTEMKGAKQIVQLLAGLPLALKVVASDLVRGQDITLLEYYDLLEDERLRLAHLVYRQDALTSLSVRASFELSFKRLQEPTQYLFTLLHLLKGSDFGIEAIIAAADIPSIRVKQALGELATMSLISRITNISQPSSGRYTLHSLLRLFSEKKFMESRIDLATPTNRLARYYAQLAHEYRQHSYAALVSDYENIIGTLTSAYQQKDWEPFVDGVMALTHIHLGIAGFLDARGYWSTAKKLLEQVLESPQAQDDANIRTWTYLKRGVFAFRQANWNEAEEFLNQSLALNKIASQTSETNLMCLAYAHELLAQLIQRQNPNEALGLVNRGLEELKTIHSESINHVRGYLQIRQGAILGQSGHIEEAVVTTKAGLSLLPKEPTSARVSAFMILGILHDLAGDTESALAQWQEGVEAAQTLGDLGRLTGLWVNMGAAESNRGHLLEAIVHKEKALEVYERIEDSAGICVTCANLGADYTHVGDEKKAAYHLERALAKSRHYSLYGREILALINRAGLFLWQGDLDQVEADLKSAEVLCQQFAPHQQTSERMRLWATLAYRRNQFAEGLNLVDKALQLGDAPNEQGLCWRLKGQILMAAGKWNLAQDAFQHGLDIFAGRNAFEVARTQLTWGQYCQEMGVPEKGSSLLEHAQQQFISLGLNHFVTQTKNVLQVLS